MKSHLLLLAILCLPSLGLAQGWTKAPTGPGTPYPTNTTPASGDSILLWDAGTNATQQIFLSTLSTYFGGGGGGSGDVTAGSNFGTDNRLIRSDGTSKGVQASAVTLDDSGNMSGVGDLAASGSTTTTTLIFGGTTITATGVEINRLAGVTSAIQTQLDAKASATAPTITRSATLATDDTLSGHTLTGLLAGAAIAQWEAVYIGGSSTYLLADANGSGTFPVRGLAVAAYSSTNAATIVTNGTVRNDAWSWTPGGNIYLSTTAGALTQTVPATTGDKIQVIGYALTADIMMVAIGTDYGTSP